MPFPGALPIVSSLEQSFYCSPLRREITVGRCLDDHAAARLAGRSHHPCHRCVRARSIRAAWGRPTSAGGGRS